jgi:hypothetical protein
VRIGNFSDIDESFEFLEVSGVRFQVSDLWCKTAGNGYRILVFLRGAMTLIVARIAGGRLADFPAIYDIRLFGVSISIKPEHRRTAAVTSYETQANGFTVHLLRLRRSFLQAS